MTVDFEPQGLEPTLQQVLAANLRALPANVLTVLENLNRGEVGTGQITELILSDPVLSWHVFEDIGKQLSERSTITLGGVGHCLTLMGTERTTRLLQNTPVLTGNADAPEQRGYRQALVNCLFAATLANDWQRVIPQMNYEHMYLAAMLQRLPEACLWQQSPQLMGMISHLVNVTGLPHEQAEQLVLGCRIHELALGMARSVRMSDPLQAAIDSSFVPTPRFLMHWSRKVLRRSPGTIEYRDESIRKPEISTALRVVLANLVAVEARRDWYGRGMRRCLKLVAAYLDMKEHDAWTRLRNTALSLARRIPDPEVATLAAGLLHPPVHIRRSRLNDDDLQALVQRLFRGEPEPQQDVPAAPTTMRVERPARPSAAPRPVPGFVSHEKQQLFEQHIARLHGEGQPFAQIQEIIRSGVDVLKACTSLERVSLGLIQISKDHIISYYSAGCETSAGLRRFEIKLTPPNLFTRLVKQPSCIWLNPERHKATIGWIPGYFRQAIDTEEFFAATLFNQRGPIAMLYADRGLSHTGMRESDFIAFRQLANATNQCLSHLTH